MTERISVSGSRGHGEYERRQRLYRVEELRAALEHAGFAVVSVFARPDGTPFEPTLSPTMWIVGQRRAVQLKPDTGFIRGASPLGLPDTFLARRFAGSLRSRGSLATLARSLCQRISSLATSRFVR
jgi:hypothetical protein